MIRACDDYDAVVAAIDEENPHVVPTDIRMPPTLMDKGIRLANQLRTSHPNVGVVVVSQYSESDDVLRLFETGPARWAELLKKRLDGRAVPLSAIRSVAAGASSVHSKIIAVLVLVRSGRANSPLAELRRGSAGARCWPRSPRARTT